MSITCLNIIFTISVIDKNIIKINNNKLSYERLQYLCHDLHECLGALVNPNNMTNHSYNQSLVLKDVFHSSLNLIRIWWNPLLRSIFEKITNPTIISRMSSNLGMGYQYLIVILLIAQLSTHICHDPSFFSVSRARIPQGLELSQIKPLVSNSSTCLFNSACSV